MHVVLVDERFKVGVYGERHGVFKVLLIIMENVFGTTAFGDRFDQFELITLANIYLDQLVDRLVFRIKINPALPNFDLFGWEKNSTRWMIAAEFDVAI